MEAGDEDDDIVDDENGGENGGACAEDDKEEHKEEEISDEPENPEEADEEERAYRHLVQHLQRPASKAFTFVSVLASNVFFFKHAFILCHYFSFLLVMLSQP